MGLLDIVITASAVCSVYVYPAMGDQAGGTVKWIFYGLCAVSLSVAFVFLMMNFYAYPMIVATDLTFKNVLKNSFYLTAVKLKLNIITLLAVAAVAAMLVFTALLNPYMLIIIIPLWALTFIGFITMFNSYPQIQKYVINPYYEERGMDNPEYDYLKPLSAEESVFTDKGGEEAPFIPEDSKRKNKNTGKGGKGKIIS